jgi:hypothetical protein
MIQPRHPDGAQARLRELVALVQAQLDLSAPLPTTLTDAFHELVSAMALGPATEVRACPVCGELGMIDATRCGSCWSKLIPPSKAIPPSPSTD